MASLSGLFSQLIDAFVAGLEPVFGRFVSSDRLVAVDDGARLEFYAVSKGKVTQLPPSDGADDRRVRRLKRARGGAVELRLSPDRLISRQLNLPAAGRAYLEPIIENRLDRLTPWRPDKVLFGYAADAAVGPDGALAVDFTATSQEVAAAATTRLAAYDLAPTALGSAAEPVGRPLRIDLYRGRRDIGRRRLRRGVVFAVVIAFALVLPALAASTALAFLADQRLAELETRLVTKRNVVRTMSGAGAAQGRDKEIIEAKRPETAMVVLIDRLSALIPDDTHLRELEVAEGKVRLAGFSTDAAALIPVLEGDPALSAVAFGAPVTRTEDGRDSFDIVAVWDQATAPAATADAAGAAGGPRVEALP